MQSSPSRFSKKKKPTAKCNFSSIENLLLPLPCRHAPVIKRRGEGSFLSPSLPCSPNYESSVSTSASTNFFTIGETTSTVGNATIKPSIHALIQMTRIPSTVPTLNTLMKNDMIQDINNAIKNENT